MAVTRAEQSWISANLPNLLMGAFALYGGYVTGKTMTEKRLDDVETQMQAMQAKEGPRRAFMQCLMLHLDRLESGVKEPPQCSLDVIE